MKNILIIQTQTQNVPISTTILSTTVVISNIVVVSTTRIPPILVGIQLTSVSKLPSSLVVMGITIVFTILGIAGFVPPWNFPSIGFYPPKGIFHFSFEKFSCSFYPSWILPWQCNPNEIYCWKTNDFCNNLGWIHVRPWWIHGNNSTLNLWDSRTSYLQTQLDYSIA